MKVGAWKELSGCLEVVKLDRNEVVGADAKLDVARSQMRGDMTNSISMRT